jgi:hypothetical protein
MSNRGRKMIGRRAHLRAVVKLQALCRAYLFRVRIEREIIMQYTNYDPEIDKRLLNFAESRKIRKLRFIQKFYREHIRIKKQRRYAKILQNTLFSYMFFFRKKMQWIKENVGSSLVISALQMSELTEAVNFFVNEPFVTAIVPGIAQYNTTSSFYNIPIEQDISVHRRKPTTIFRYASSYHRDVMYRIRFRQPVFSGRKKRKRPESVNALAGSGTPDKPSVSMFTKGPANIFRSKLTEMVQVSSRGEKGPEGDSQLTKLYFILQRRVDVYSLQQIMYGCAAIAVQRMWRGVYCRKKMLPILIANIVEKRSVVLLQRWWRNRMGLQKRFRILNSVLTAVRKIDSATVYIDVLTFFQLLQAKSLPALSHSVEIYPEFSGIPVVNLNGQVMFKRFDRTGGKGRQRKASSAKGSSAAALRNDRRVKDRCIPIWITLIKMASEHRYNSASYCAGSVSDADGIAQMKSNLIDPTAHEDESNHKDKKKKHSTKPEGAFSQGRVMFNLLTNGCNIGLENAAVTFERRAGIKGHSTRLGSLAVVRLEFPSRLEARCRCAAVMLATMDTGREESVCLLSGAELALRAQQLTVLSDTLPAPVLRQLLRNPCKVESSAFGDPRLSSSAAPCLGHTELVSRAVDDRSRAELCRQHLGDACIVLNMATQTAMYLYNDLFSMGAVMDDDTRVATAATSGRVGAGVTGAARVLGRDLCPLPFLRAVADPLEYTTRLVAWPRLGSTPAHLRRERRSGDDCVRFQFFLESLKMYIQKESGDGSGSETAATNKPNTNNNNNNSNSNMQTGVSGNTNNEGGGGGGGGGRGRGGSARLRPAAMYRNKNATDSTGAAYWGAWEQEIPLAALNGVRPASSSGPRPSSPSLIASSSRPTSATISVTVNRAKPASSLVNSGNGFLSTSDSGILGVFPADAPKPPEPVAVSTDKIMFAHAFAYDQAEEEGTDSAPASARAVAAPATAPATAAAAEGFPPAGKHQDQAGRSWADGAAHSGPTNRPGSPRWLRRHLWSIPRVLMWCADNINDDHGPGRHGNMTGYAELVRTKRKSDSDHIDALVLDATMGNDDDSNAMVQRQEQEQGQEQEQWQGQGQGQGQGLHSPRRVTGVSPCKASKRASTAAARLDIVQHVRDRARLQEQSISLDTSRAARASTARGAGAGAGGGGERSSTLESPRPMSPFFHDHSYPISKQDVGTDGTGREGSGREGSGRGGRRPTTASARLDRMDSNGNGARCVSPSSAGAGGGNGGTGQGEYNVDCMPTSPITGSTQYIRSGKEEFVRSRISEARGLRQNLEASRHLTELEHEAEIKEKQMKIQYAKDHITTFDLQGKLEKKRESLKTANRELKQETDKQFEAISDDKKLEEERNRQRIRDQRELISARSKHRVNVYKNNVTLNALSKYSKRTQLQELKDRERQKVLDMKKRNVRATKGIAEDLYEINDAAAAAFTAAAGLHFDESSITDSLDSSELQKGMLMSDYRTDSVLSAGQRKGSLDSSRVVMGVMLQQSVLSRTVEAVESMLSRSSAREKEHSVASPTAKGNNNIRASVKRK